MSDKEILEKAINGKWRPTETPSSNGWIISWVNDHTIGLQNATVKNDTASIHYTLTLNIYELIFSHDFAKSIWPEPTSKRYMFFKALASDYSFRWQYHLQQMVIASDPIKYLGEHLDAR